MNKIATLPTFLAALALVASLGAEKAPIDAKSIDKWIAELGSSRYGQREKAQKELEALGSKALEPLRRAAKGNDLETSRRAAEILRRLEEKLSNESLLAPKLVNLQLDNVSVLDAINELSKQSGYAIQVAGDRTALASRKISLKTGQVSFFEALDKLCEVGKVSEQSFNASVPIRPNPRGPIRIQPVPQPPAAPQLKLQIQGQVQAQVQAQLVQVQALQALPALPIAQAGQGLVVAGGPVGPRQIVLADGAPKPVPTSYAGSVRVRLLPLEMFPRQKNEGETVLVLDTLAEPRLTNFRLLGAPSISSAIDDQGQSLSVATDMAPMGNAVQPAPINRVGRLRTPIPGFIAPQQIRLKLGEKPATRLKELRGTLTAQVQLPPEPLLVLDKILDAKGKTTKANGGSLTLDNLEKTGDSEYRLHVSIENANALGAALGGGAIQIVGNANVRVQMIQNGRLGGTQMPVLLDADGKAWQLTQIPQNSMQINNGEMRQNLTLVYRANSGQGAPDRLVVQGSRTTNMTVPFAFANVPLP